MLAALFVCREGMNQRIMMRRMGFVLWIDAETACCAGTHEYRPMGTAVVAASDLFASRDFRPMRPSPSRLAPHFHGLFASLGEVNRYLRRRRAPADPAARVRGIL